MDAPSSSSDADLGRFVSLADFEAPARLAMDPAAFDYVAGGAWDELSLRANDEAWRRYRLRPRVLVDVAIVDPSTTMLGMPTSLPVAIAPMAVQGLAHPDGEVATARAAGAAGIPFTLSTTSSRSIEEVAAGAPDAKRWFQLYVQVDPGRTRELVERAAAAGYRAIVLTVDLPRLGYRERDRRSLFELPALGNFAAWPATHAGGAHVDGFEMLDRQLEVGLTWDDLANIRSWSGLPFVLKGILTAEDAVPRRRARRRCHRGQQPRRAAARPDRGRRSTSSRRSSTPSPAVPRSGSTAASDAGWTSRSRWRSARARC